jgi:hypothetical protein
MMLLQDPGQSEPGMAFVIAMLTAITIILWPVMRALARRLDGSHADAGLRAEVDQLHHRLSEMDSLQGRLLELEERVDFAERVLAQTHETHKGMIPGENS